MNFNDGIIKNQKFYTYMIIIAFNFIFFDIKY